MTDALAYDPLARFHDVKVTTPEELAEVAIDMARTTAAELINNIILICEEQGKTAVSLDILRLLAEQIAKIRIPTSSS